MYFYTVGNMLGVDRINKWATLLGLGVKIGHRPAERGRRGWCRRPSGSADACNEKWYAGETISVAIGQGQVSVTPVSMAVYMATLANGGTRVTPHLVKAVDDGQRAGSRCRRRRRSRRSTSRRRSSQAIRDGLWMVVNGGGTGGRARIEGHDVCGKTGTAQVISNAGRMPRPAAGRTCATTAGSCSSRRATIRRSPASCSSSTASTARTPRRSRITSSRRYFAKQDGKPLPPPPTHEDLRLDYKDPYARGGGAPAGGGQ